MVSLFQALVLGLVQGLAEFLPVSSSAHLILVPSYLHWPDPGLSFDVALHLGSLLAVVLYYWRELAQMGYSFIRPSDRSLASVRRLALLIFIATVPGALAGLLLERKAETVFRSATLIAWSTIGLGILLWLADWWGAGQKPLSEMRWPMALGIGLTQSLALIPGVSRSGITITAALALGFQRREAARYSFLMSVPIIAGAGVLKFGEILRAADQAALWTGFLAAAVSGLLAISFLLKYVQTRRYTPFVLYRWALGAFVLLNLSRFR